MNVLRKRTGAPGEPGLNAQNPVEEASKPDQETAWLCKEMASPFYALVKKKSLTLAMKVHVFNGLNGVLGQNAQLLVARAQGDVTESARTS